MKKECECTDECLGYLTKECKRIEEPKQETLEEAAKRMYGNDEDGYYIQKRAFKIGAKWQQEQDKNKYSEEDLKEAFAMGRTNATIKDFNTKFKNK